MSQLSWIVSLLIARSYFVAGEDIKVKWGQDLGFKHCQKKCSERKGCTNIDYAAEALSCTFRFNVTHISHLQDLPSCRRHFCTERVVLMRSKNIPVLVVFSDLESASAKETLLTFKSIPRYRKCKQSGRKGHILESTPDSYCGMKTVQMFRKDQPYSCVFSHGPYEGVPCVLSFTVYSFKRRGVQKYGSFTLTRRWKYYDYKSGKKTTQTVTNSSQARLELVLHNNLLTVTNLNNRDALTPVNLKADLSDFFAEIILSKISHCTFAIKEGKSQP